MTKFQTDHDWPRLTPQVSKRRFPADCQRNVPSLGKEVLTISIIINLLSYPDAVYAKSLGSTNYTNLAPYTALNHDM